MIVSIVARLTWIRVACTGETLCSAWHAKIRSNTCIIIVIVVIWTVRIAGLVEKIGFVSACQSARSAYICISACSSTFGVTLSAIGFIVCIVETIFAWHVTFEVVVTIISDALMTVIVAVGTDGAVGMTGHT